MADTLTANKTRIESIDLLRGLVMIIMALDHTRDFFHHAAFTEDPLNPATTYPALYFTRWITHFCAPVFVFLSGASAWLQSRKKSKKELSSFLIKRGLWLILMEITIINFSFSFDIHFNQVALQTIWSIGISMVILGLVIWLPFNAILALGLLIVLGHNALDYYEKANPNGLSTGYHILHQPGFFNFKNNFHLLVMYPFLSWTGLMLMGYCFGKLLYTTQGPGQKKILLGLGIGITLFFILLRFLDIYGDPDVINGTGKPIDSLYSFLDTRKYPPSLLYTTMTIGPALLFMAFFPRNRSRIGKMIAVYGRVPFFYYIIHFYLIHLISMGFFLARGHSFKDGLNNQVMTPNFLKPGEGVNLWWVYLVWASVVISLYPLCKWYDNYKTSHKDKWWLSYL
ncbi:MAG TPA: heparan-alpha-glucosaminide N-acetyltransferase domain-containing protein [Chitinophagaceae bacterium]|nr:heparan-alpha-glucosaminide N-acetyltransferase domain-containing protein [Chitinophagaceae bacterium]